MRGGARLCKLLLLPWTELARAFLPAMALAYVHLTGAAIAAAPSLASHGDGLGEAFKIVQQQPKFVSSFKLALSFVRPARRPQHDSSSIMCASATWGTMRSPSAR